MSSELQNQPDSSRYRGSKARRQLLAGLNINHQGRHRERLEVRPRPKSGRAATLRRMASNAPVWAARCCRQNVEVRIVTESEKKSIFTRTSDSRHTSNHHANGQARKHGQQTIKRRDPFGRELAERDIVPAQIRQEQKSQRS